MPRQRGDAITPIPTLLLLRFPAAEWYCRVAEASKLIESSSATTAKNNAQIKNDALDINKMRIDIESLTTTSSGAHDEFMTIPPQRDTAIGEAMQRIDERAKALSVITKATFVVCERFTRFKNSAQCLRIKVVVSQCARL